MVLKFRVKGQDPDAYEVVFEKAGDVLRVTCSCQAGNDGLYCEHRNNLIYGDTSNLLAGHSDVKKIAEMMKGSKLMSAIEELYYRESELEEFKQSVLLLKKKVGRLCNGN
jgi:hypothetical protein